MPETAAASPLDPMGAASFDRDAYLATVAPPVFLIGGRRVVGRVLSWEEWLPLEAAIEAVSAGRADRRAMAQLVRDVCQAMFPAAAPAPWWRRVLAACWPVAPTPGGEPPGESVYDAVRRLPYLGQIAAIKGFAERQAEIQYGPRLVQTTGPTAEQLPQPTPPALPAGTNGTDSPG